jgi:RecA/RadA recombinase
MSIMDKLKKNSKIKETSILADSKFFKEKDKISTSVPMINVALSGEVNGGLTSGLTVLAGPSKHFKTSFALLMAAAYLNAYEDAILLFYDSEFGSPQSYFKTFGIDTNRVLHCPIKNIEELKFDIVSQLENIERTDKVIIVVDSIGNLASKKEIEDALDNKSVADMTRAKQLKSVFRMVTPYLTMNDIPMICVNHTYDTQEMFSKKVVSGGTGIYYSSDNIWIIGRQQEKEGTEVVGYNFIINIEKSRYVKEKSKIPIGVSWSGGIQKWSGLLDLAVEGNFVHKGRKGRSLGYCYMDNETGEIQDDKMFYEKETMNAEFWESILNNQKFHEFIRNKYMIKPVEIEE